MADTKHPMQPVQWDGEGVIRFKANAIVRYLLDYASARGCSLNELALMRFSNDDWTQLAQLIGYSVSGAGDLSYFDRAVIDRADADAEKLAADGPDPRAPSPTGPVTSPVTGSPERDDEEVDRG